MMRTSTKTGTDNYKTNPGGKLYEVQKQATNRIKILTFPLL